MNSTHGISHDDMKALILGLARGGWDYDRIAETLYNIGPSTPEFARRVAFAVGNVAEWTLGQSTQTLDNLILSDDQYHALPLSSGGFCARARQHRGACRSA